MILSFNLCKGRFWTGNFMKTLDKLQPKIICLQESTDKLAREIASIGKYHIINSLGHEDTCINTTLICKSVSILNEYQLPLTGISRSVVFHQVNLNNTNFTIGNLHLKSGPKSSNIRKRQINSIINYTNKTDKAILIGDWNLRLKEISWPIYFNRESQSQEIEWKSHELLPTFRYNNTVQTNCPFDRVLYKGLDLSITIKNGQLDSDHDILLCQLK